MKILIPEQIAVAGIEKLQNHKSFDVHFDPKLDYEAVLGIIENYDAIVTRSGTPITEELLEKATNLKLIGRAGIGVDNINIPAASKRGILVINVPAGNILAATEHTIALLLATTRRLHKADLSIREGRWDRKAFMGVELNKKTLGVIGFGKIGSRVSKRLRAFDMEIIAYDPYVKAERIESFGVEKVSLEELLKRSDFITVHTPLTDETKGMIGKKEIELMKEDVRLVNCARGGIYNEDDLYEALKKNKIKAAAIDVFESEPATDHRFTALDNIVLTPHIGANTAEAQDNVAVEIAEQFIKYDKEHFLASALNAPFSDMSVAESLSPYMNLVEKMAKILEEEASDAISEFKISIEGFESDAAKPLAVSAVKGLLEPILGESVNYVNALFEAEERGLAVKWEYSKKCQNFKQKVTLKIKTKNAAFSIAGTCFSDEFQRIVSIDSFDIELKAEGFLLLVRNEDIPGVIGRIGTLFGEFNINIAEYRLGRSKKSKDALAAIILDQKPDQAIFKKLNEITGVKETHFIEI